MSQQSLLDALYNHGQGFLGRFGTSQPPNKRRKLSSDSDGAVDEEEWTGISTLSDEGSVNTDGSSEEDETSDTQEQGAGFNISSPDPEPSVVVFSDSKTTALPPKTKNQKKTFMSSRVSKLNQDSDSSNHRSSRQQEDAEENEKTNQQNDAALYRLVHTQLLTGSLNTELDLTPAQRRKALQGRVMELAGYTSLGKGEKSIRREEMGKAAKRVREGLAFKQKEREQKRLEEAKNLGNYHPTLKKLYDSDFDRKLARKRDKGLAMGVGKFSGGVLKLGKAEINTIHGNPTSSGRRKRNSRRA
ncbi:hypothetical protein PUNSTDRAFT_125426 [Punctularia strigosozonata HHB-11173 SS5]|uniref:uncharacterized protein n=1 Tax=Punctularia strigosozonata (strain HHB-11173) TaxID=741275 RepID=UPI00044177A6|nr:uncharacterized protein PUNSTDRAFT_125426 [Punctularia strigosozonata HHB-11173 SS5]EIN10700.1 hypothetical protein PUNSTDRAFT_125426 [Punctularia strigosozonata HHB-11173 SS5]